MAAVRRLVLFIILCLHLPLGDAVAACYRPESDHNKTSAIYVPCNQQTAFSMCYRSQVDAGGSPADSRCLAQGIALNINTKGEYEYWRQSCTDKTWKSDYCLTAFNACPNDSNGNAKVSPCGGIDSIKWCCGGNNTACCDTAGAIVIAATIGVVSSTSLSTTSQSSTISVTTSTTPTPSPSPTSLPAPAANKSGLSTGAKAGIGIAAALGGVAVLLGIIGFAIRRTRKSRRDSETPLHEMPVENSNKQGHLYEAPGPEAFAPVKGYQGIPAELPTIIQDRYQ